MDELSKGVRGLLEKGTRFALSEAKKGNRMMVGSHAFDAMNSLRAFYSLVRKDTLTKREVNLLWQHLDMTEMSLEKARTMLEGLAEEGGHRRVPKGHERRQRPARGPVAKREPYNTGMKKEPDDA